MLLVGNRYHCLFIGEIVAVDITTKMPALDGRLSEAFNDAVINRPDLFLELAKYSICMVVAKPSNSIEVLIYCGESENMRKFIDFFNSGDLDKLLNKVLEKLLGDADSVSLEAKVYIRQKEVTLVEQFAEQKGKMLTAFKVFYFACARTVENKIILLSLKIKILYFRCL